MPLTLITSEAAEYFYDELYQHVYEHAATVDKQQPTTQALKQQTVQGSSILALRGTLGDILHTLTASEPQLFTDVYSRVLFVADKYALPGYIVRELNAFRRISGKFHRNRTTRKSMNTATLHSSVRALALLVFHFSTVRAPEALRAVLLQAEPFTQEPQPSAERQAVVRLTVQRKDAPQSARGRTVTRVYGISADGDALCVELWDMWSDMTLYLWEFATLHCTNVQFVEQKIVEQKTIEQETIEQKANEQKANEQQANEQHTNEQRTDKQNNTDEASIYAVYATTADSIVVLEPDYLMDATELAECVQGKLPFGGNPRLALLRKFVSSDVSAAMTAGNVANYCFDVLLTNPDAEFATVFHEAILQKPLQIIALQVQNNQSLAHIRLQASGTFETTRNLLRELHFDKASVEASFMSPLYGLQGRLDVLLEYADDPRRKTIIELKAGKPPKEATWENNAAQVTAYNLLLDSCSGDSSILYARDSERPLRNVPNDRAHKQNLMMLRNRIIWQDYTLLSRGFKLLRDIHPDHFGAAAVYMNAAIADFAYTFSTASELERKYFQLFVSFVLRENWATRIGSERGEGFSGLWRKSVSEKAKDYVVLSDLVLETDASNFEQQHLSLVRTEQTEQLTNFRNGDIVLLYPILPDDTDERSFLRGSMLKGYIKRITPERVTVSLRNKQLGVSAESYGSDARWAIEPDFIGSEFKAQYESLYAVLSAPVEKRHQILGLAEPTFDDTVYASALTKASTAPEYASLTDEQRERLAQAVSARDYFLLQGPPGTGKTSRMLKSMARYLFDETQEEIMLLAFTNRAVDEICDALKDAKLDFIRLGAKESTVHTDHVLYELIAGKSLEEIQTIVQGARIVVSTISSLLKNPEIVSIKSFSTVIVDEASQVVEPQIVGLLTKFRRFILVGDEKQLPAVVVQPERGVFTSDKTLNEAGIFDLRTSLFERLLVRCDANGWHRAFGLISRQGRMHTSVAAFPNAAFYGGALQTLAEWQTDESSAIALPRLMLWESGAESQNKVHEQEAERVAALVAYVRAQIGDSFHAHSLGVITPFRAQIAAIHRHIAPELVGMVSVDTVERYQGSERDVIIVSFAVSSGAQLRSIQSLSRDGSVDRKLNVALTRARGHLIVLGCTEALSHSPIFSQFFAHVQHHGIFVGKNDIPPFEGLANIA
jgi:DNA replication ATP-dependent helicase Dna2